MNLKELSELLGLSQTTVSRALNGYPEVSEATRLRVEHIARENNYIPSSRARSLALGRSMAIGHVIPVSTQHELVNPVFGDFMAGAGEIYSAQGYEMVLRLVPDDDEARVYQELRAKGNVDGLVLHGPRVDDGRIDLLSQLGLPFVVHGRTMDVSSSYSWVDVANTEAFRQATRHLLDLGHRRIGLINGSERMAFAHRRRRGFEEALAKANIAPDGALMHAAEMTESNGFMAASRMLNAPNPPSAFVVSSTISALGVQRAVTAKGGVLGQDVSVVAFDDDLSYLRNEGAGTPVFTVLRSSVREAGRYVARILLSQIAQPGTPPQNHMMALELIQGTSTGPFKAN